MASAEDAETQELNLIFKSLGKRGPDEKELYESLVELMGKLSKDMSMISGNHIMAQIYGSTAEDLKSRRGEFRFGDFDIMAFPTSDNLMIRDELIEYLPENPLHVRIKATDHPVFQSCLVEGTEYVATTILKNFHPAIYGSLGSLLTACLQLVSRVEDINYILPKSLPLTIHPKNNESSPALTISFTAKRNIDSKSNREGGRMESCLGDEAMQFCVPPDICHEVASLIRNRGKGNLMPRSGDGDQASAANIRQPSTKESLDYQVPEKMISKQLIEDLGGKDSDHKSDKNNNGDQDGNQNQCETKEQFLAKGEPVITCKQTNPFEIDQSMNPVLEHKLGKGVTETKIANFKESRISKPPQSLVGIDFVPAFRSQGWPKVAREWKERDRKWPSLKIVDRVIQGGFHLVVKPSKMSGYPDCDFRISFSHAEYLLSKEMNDIQRECYRCLKTFHRAFLSTEPKGLVTYHLKNILLKTIEETGAEMWTESNRAECMMKLFENLLHALRMKDLQHFFVRPCNLLCDDYVENPKILESLVGKVKQIMKNPIKFSKQLIQEQFDGKECDIMPSLQAFIEQFLKDEVSFFSSCRGYDELKDSFLATCKELIDTVVDKADCSLEDLDPLKKSIVEDIRDMKMTKKELYKAFVETFESVYLKVSLSTEPNTRRRMLDGIKAALELIKYRVQHTLDAKAADEELFSRKIFDPNDLLHWSQFLPAASGPPLIRCPMLKTAAPQQFGMDDIPLD